MGRPDPDHRHRHRQRRRRSQRHPASVAGTGHPGHGQCHPGHTRHRGRRAGNHERPVRHPRAPCRGVRARRGSGGRQR
ncbi:hypothetical protein [Ornithinimicrobium kibberense]|uniref:hypothetical protein n=1 Tax=Ornithinimicrobium kibberense TaxID=282060 RepID=UPI003609FB35